MKHFIIIITILICSTCIAGQTRKTTAKVAVKKPVEAEIKKEPPTQKVVVEKANGDKLTGLFVSADQNSVTINISDTNIPINLSEIKVIWIGEAKPEPPVIQTPTINYAANAIKALRQLSAATDVGVNFQDYGRRVIDVKAEVEDFLPNIDDEYVKNEIKLAMNAYADASSAWNFSVQNRGYLFIDFEPAITLRPKYNIPTTQLGRLTLISNETALSTIWSAAKTHIENAQRGKPAN